MNISSRWFRRQVAGALVLLMAAPFSQAAMAPLQESTQQLPNAPNPQTRPQATGDAVQLAQAEVPQAATDPQQNSGTKPVGTAAAPLPASGGVAASRPAGAVIAPGKQRRVRAILISVGVVIGAAVAVGTVVALSRSSPARPN
jgi:hypothetical protein